MNEVTQYSIENAYHKAIKYAKSHYENFPVVSFLIPKELKKHIAIIYWFARTADDFSDEGHYSEGERLEKLNEFELGFKNSLRGKPPNEYYLALSTTVREKNLTPAYFYNLLKAFKQDVIKNRYKDFNDVLNYCKYSANPVGRLILELFNVRDDDATVYSDQICTALQLTNFLQDTMIDYEKGRIYLPQDEMQRFNVTEKLFEEKQKSLNLKLLVKYNVDRIQSIFNEGKGLYRFLQGRLKREIGWTVRGGEEILGQIRKNDYDIISHRPELGKIRMAFLLLQLLLKKDGSGKADI
jgi:squalene synthase HpnC